jgi:hypothetical protein
VSSNYVAQFRCRPFQVQSGHYCLRTDKLNWLFFPVIDFSSCSWQYALQYLENDKQLFAGSKQWWSICPQPSKCPLSPAMEILTEPPVGHNKTLTLLECLAQTTQAEPSSLSWPYQLQTVTEIRYCQRRFILSKTTHIAWCVVMATDYMRCLYHIVTAS